MLKPVENQITKACVSGSGSASQLREYLYKTFPCVEVGDDLLTVNDANTLFQAYFAEGNTARADELSQAISAAKEKIREENPDEL